MPRICKASHGEKVFLNIFISIYVNLNGFRKTNMSIAGNYRDVHSAQGPVNSILCTGEILTGLPHASTGYIIIIIWGS
jgi:hypothetical protein